MSKKKKSKADEPVSHEKESHAEAVHHEGVESHEEITSEMIPYDNGVELVDPIMAHKKFDKFKGEKK